MVTVLALLGVLGVLFAAAVLSTREQGLLAEASPDDPDVPLPEEPLTPDDVGRLRFSMAARGYRMSEVDLALERLTQELADRDKRIGLLEAATRGKSKPEPVAAVREATPRDLPVSEERVVPSVVVAPQPVPAPLLEPEPAAPEPAPEPTAPEVEPQVATEPEPVAAAEPPPPAAPTPYSPTSLRPTAWSSPSAVPAFPVIDAPETDSTPPRPDLPSALVAEEQADDRADLDDRPESDPGRQQ